MPPASGGIVLRVDVGDVLRGQRRLELWAREQLPFAVAAALTDTARDAQSFVRQGFSSHFKLRNRGLLNAIAYRAADKRDSPPTSGVGVRPWAAFLDLQVTGGIKRARGARVAVPTRLVKRTATGRVQARLKPRVLRDAKGFDPKALQELERIVVHRGGSKARRGLAIFYNLVGQAKIRKRWPLREEVEETARARLPEHFAARAAQALKG